MILTRKQEEGLRIALSRYKHHEKYTIISGYAGTGKTTLVHSIIEALPIDLKDVVFCSFTGKAAEVLRQKGNENATTLHHLLFNFVPQPNGTFLRRPKLAIGYKVVVVDEISMAPKSLIDVLFSYPCYIIGLGDPGQLPPIDDGENNHLLDHPHIFLDEIMRQAADSEIIQLTMKIRNNERITTFDGKDVKVITKSNLNTGMLQWADQVLVATNATRLKINLQMRQLQGRGDTPEDGDKMICLRNYWEDLNDNNEVLVNGTVGYIHNVYTTQNKLPNYCGGKHFTVLGAEFTSNNGASYGTMDMDLQLITTGKDTLDYKTKYKLGRSGKTRSLIPKEFAYGYAITCHKAQGSEWNRVLVIEERFPFDKDEHKKWLYTAATRAADKLVLVLK